MKKVGAASLLAVALLLLTAAPSLAWSGHGHGHGHFHGGARFFVGVGPAYWWGAPYPYYYPYYPPYYPYYYPPAVAQEPPVYVQQEPAQAVPPASTVQEGYWYFCPSSRQYYPQAASCPEAWIKVPPRQD